MAVAVELPKLGLKAPALLVAEWYLPDGATVQRGEAVCRVETNDVALELEAEREGILRHRVESGLERPGGEVLGVILGAGERMPELPAVETSPAPVVASRHLDLPTEEEWQDSVRAMRYWAGQTGERANGRAAPGEAREQQRTDIVQFPKRPSFPAPSWEPVPGGTDDFESALLGHRPAALEFAPDPVADAAVDARLSIAHAPESVAVAGVVPGHLFETAASEPEAVPAAAAATVAPAELVGTGAGLSMRSAVDLTEVHKLRAQLGREWGAAPGNEAVVLRAVGRALAELGRETDVSLLTFESGAVRNGLLRNANVAPFRQPVTKSGEGGERSACVVSLFPEIDEAEPKLEPGAAFALTIGAERTVVRWEGERVTPAPALTLTLRCEPEQIEPFQAARFLARVRELIEAPYALLVA